MHIKIDNTYFVETDALNYTLKEQRSSKSGKPYVNILGHFGSIEGVFSYLIEHKIKVSKDCDLIQIQQLLNETLKQMKEITKELTK